jgi:hypothetical protein
MFNTRESSFSASMKQELVKRVSTEDLIDEYKTPLELYDDLQTFETCSPVVYLTEAKGQGLKGAKAFSRYFHYHHVKSDWDWLPCWVLDYELSSKSFTIEWVPSGIQKKVGRLNLLFENESKELFYQRIEYAVKTRNKVEQAQKTRELILTEKSAPIAPLPKTIKMGILVRIGRQMTVREMPVIVSFTFMYFFKNY